MLSVAGYAQDHVTETVRAYKSHGHFANAAEEFIHVQDSTPIGSISMTGIERHWAEEEEREKTSLANTIASQLQKLPAPKFDIPVWKIKTKRAKAKRKS